MNAVLNFFSDNPFKVSLLHFDKFEKFKKLNALLAHQIKAANSEGSCMRSTTLIFALHWPSFQPE